MVPLYSHRYLPAAPAAAGSPVFSIYQTDVIYYGDDLADYIGAEFGQQTERRREHSRMQIKFWSDLADGEDFTPFR